MKKNLCEKPCFLASHADVFRASSHVSSPRNSSHFRFVGKERVTKPYECLRERLNKASFKTAATFWARTSTGSGIFALLSRVFKQMFGQIASLRVKTIGKTNLVASRHIKTEKGSPPVNELRTKTSLPKLIVSTVFLAFSSHFPRKRACMPQLFWKKARQIDLPTVKRISFNHWISPFVMEKVSNNKIRDLIHSFKKSSTTFDQRLPLIFGFVSYVLGPLTSWLFRQILSSLEHVSYSVVQPRGAFFCLNSV